MRAQRKGENVGISRMAQTLIVISAGILPSCASDPRSGLPPEISGMTIVDSTALSSSGPQVDIVRVSYRTPDWCGRTFAERIIIRSYEGASMVNLGDCTIGLRLGVRTDRRAIGVGYPNGKWLEVRGNQLVDPIRGVYVGQLEPLPASLPRDASNRRGLPGGSNRPPYRGPAGLPQVNVPPATLPAQTRANTGPVPSSTAPPLERVPQEIPSFPSGPAPSRSTPEPVPVPTFAL